MDKPIYKRILLKISGEVLQGERDCGISLDVLEDIADEVGGIRRMGVDVAVVVGGGNLIRGAIIAEKGIDRASADYMGMLATIINAVAFQNILEAKGISTRLMSALEIRQVAEPFIRRRALRHIEKGRVVIFAAGTGNPYFTTDTAAALRAMEIGSEVILKGTKVKGVFDRDPELYPLDAQFFPELTYIGALERNLKVMDSTAISLCRDHGIPIIVFNIRERDNIRRIVLGEKVGTIIR